MNSPDNRTEGQKGMCLIYTLIFFGLLIILMVAVYHRNFQLEF